MGFGIDYDSWTQMNIEWDRIGFTMATPVRHCEHPEIPYMNTSSLDIS